MSHHSCETARMQSERIEWDIVELKQNLLEWEDIASALTNLLREEVRAAKRVNWVPHFDQITRAVQRFRDLCCREREQLGTWRDDGLEPCEIYDRVVEQGERLTTWLLRMVQR